MTIDEAISHALEVAEQKERDSAELIDILDELDVDACKECAADHRQLAEWLTELKEAKRLLKAAVEDFPDLTDMWRYADKALKLIGGSENG